MVRFYGVLAQLVERLVRNQEVRGSTPLHSTMKMFICRTILSLEKIPLGEVPTEFFDLCMLMYVHFPEDYFSRFFCKQKRLRRSPSRLWLFCIVDACPPGAITFLFFLRTGYPVTHQLGFSLA